MPRIWRAMVAGLAALLAVNGAQAQTQAQTAWPTRPVRVIVPYAPGSGTDFIVRSVAERLSRQTGQQFVVEHRGGSSGALGTEAVVKSSPDGYTLLMTPQAPVVVIPHLRKLPYDALKDLVGVARFGQVIAGFAVHPSLGVTNMTEFVALAKKQPGKITFVSAGVGSVNHLRGETLKLMAGIDLLHVPYRGNGEAVPDLLAGQVHSIFDSLVFPHVKANKLVLLAILDDERYSEFPNIPTMKEQGFPDFDIPIWVGAYFAAGVPMPIIEKLHQEVSGIYTDQEFRDRMFAGGWSIYRQAETLAAFRDRLSKQSSMFAELIKRADIKME